MAKNVTLIPPANVNNGPIALDEIPESVKKLAEKIYEHVRKTGSRVRLEWEKEDEMALELQQIASYAVQRKQGRLKFRISPTRNLPDLVKDVRLTADIESNGQAAGNGGQGVAAKA